MEWMMGFPPFFNYFFDVYLFPYVSIAFTSDVDCSSTGSALHSLHECMLEHEIIIYNVIIMNCSRNLFNLTNSAHDE